jgi:hypothetical protein
MATVTASKTWVSGETVTPAGLNLTAAPTVVVADNEVTTAKILDANVTNAKLATGIDAAKITTGTLPIARIADDAVTNAKLATGIDASKLTTGTLPADRIGLDAITTARILNAAVTPAKLSQPLTLETSKASTSGTSVDFTSIPSWAKRITVMLSGVSTSGTWRPILRIGDAGGFEDTGYSSIGAGFNSAIVDAITGGFALTYSVWGPAQNLSGNVTLVNISGNTWTLSSVLGNTAGAIHFGAGTKTLSDVLTQVRLTTVNGTDTFDAGTVNIMYEG